MMNETALAKTSGLKLATIKAINGILAKHPNIQQAILYGSRAKGSFRNGSDIDLVLVGDDIGYSELHRIESEIDDLLLPYNLDLSLYHSIDNPELLEHIKRVGLVLYQS